MNTRKTVLATLLAAAAVTPLAVTPLAAQAQAHAPAAYVYTQAELDQMLAPIALYPDALLSQVLMAATYPIEVVEAARWSRANPGLRGDEAVRAVQHEDWDPSVKSLCAFPEILQRMDEKLEWTRALGDAFLAQEPQVMDQVQRLRQRAAANGNLRSDEQIRVVHEGPVIVVRPARPEYIYVPYYDPLVVYGDWWWPDYRPVYWAPWPGYARPRPSYAFWWGRPIGISLNFFFGDFDWGRRHVRVAHHSYYYRQPVYYSRAYSGDRTRWQHDPHHRRAVAYRNTEVRQRFATAQMERRENVREERREARQFERRDAAPAQRTERREDRRDERRVDRMAAPAAIAAPAQPAVEPRAERRGESRMERREDRSQESRIERREERREERRSERQVAPAQPALQPRTEQRDDRRAEEAQQQQARRQAQESQRQAQQQARQQEQAAHRQAQEAQRQAQAAQRQAQEAQRQAQHQAQQQARQQAQQARQEQRAAPPAAQAAQQQRIERQERREERREQRKDRDKG